VQRDGECLPATASCWLRFQYEWDEIGHLIDAQRWDLVGAERTAASALAETAPARTADLELAYTYDQAGNRTLKNAIGPGGSQADTAYIFSSLELQRTTFDTQTDDYALDPSVETPYLAGIGRNIGRVVYETTSVPTATSGQVHVFLDLPDNLGSSSIVIDHDTSELVERGTYTAFGQDESDYRTPRWGDFREDTRFTGKEDDIEVGLLYFGARYYAPALGRWISPDPLALHSPGAEDDNLYAYGHGRVFAGTDPDGRIFGIDDLIFIGICILVATLVAGAVDTGTQVYKIEHGQQASFDVGELGIACVAGAVAGATAGAGTVALGGGMAASATLFGSKILAGIAIGVTSSVAGGMTSRGLKGQNPLDGQGLAVDAAIGVAAWGVGEVVGAAVKGLSGGGASSSIGRGLDGADSSAAAGSSAPGGAGAVGEPVGPSQTIDTSSLQANPNPNILSGHGSLKLQVGDSGGLYSPITQVPEGTTVTVWTTHGNTISNGLGNSIETGSQINLELNPEIIGAKTYLSGSYMPEYTLSPIETSWLKGNPTTVAADTQVTNLVKANAGNVQWAACQVVMKPIVIMNADQMGIQAFRKVMAAAATGGAAGSSAGD
jgi:RHS repeat-associated protein